MLKRHFLYPAVLTLTALAVPALPAALETVRLDGASGAHTTLNDAIASVSDGGVIEITQAGDYQQPDVPTTANVTIIGGKSYTIRATVSGVTISEGILTDPTTGAIDVTLENISVDRLGTGAAMYVEQHNGGGSAGNSVTVHLKDMLLQSAEGEGMRIDGVGTDGGLVTLTAENTTFSSLGGSNKAALRVSTTAGGVPSGSGPVNGLSVSLTDTVLTSANYRGIRNDGGSNQSWTLDGCTITSLDRGFEVNQAGNDNNTYELTDTTITSNQECIHDENKSTNTTWTLNRCKLDGSGGTLSDRAMVLRDSNLTPNFTVNLYNTIVLAQPNTDGMETTRVNLTAYHCTFVGSGEGSIAEGIDANTNTGLVFDVKNSVFQGFDRGINSSSSVANTSDYNVFDGAEIDTDTSATRTDLGANSAINATLNLDANYAPQAGSAAIQFGSTDSGIATAIGNVDYNGNARPNPVATNPDAGAFEVGGSSTNDWHLY